MIATNSKLTRVWVRSLGSRCRLRVEGVEIAKWLIDRLTEQNVLAGLEYLDLQPTTGGCEFEISLARGRSLRAIESALSRMEHVQLMLEPESI